MKTGAKGLNKLSEGFESLFDRIKDLLKHICIKKGRCFTGDTLVPTKHGYTAIKEIQKGDEILSRDEKTGRTGFKEVEDVFIRAVHTIYHVWLDGKEEIKTTAYHPVYVQEQGWVTAINLREGDTLETMEGTACITKIVKKRHEEPVTVYNIAVKDWVSYFVGQVRVYVHNGNGYEGDSKIANYYVGPNGKILLGEYKDWIGTNIQNKLLSQADNPQLRNAIKELYRGKSFIGDGGTADVIKFEQKTGIMLGRNGGSHIQKGIDMASYIQNKILTQNLSSTDRALATKLLDDLNSALDR